MAQHVNRLRIRWAILSPEKVLIKMHELRLVGYAQFANDLLQVLIAFADVLALSIENDKWRAINEFVLYFAARYLVR